MARSGFLHAVRLAGVLVAIAAAGPAFADITAAYRCENGTALTATFMNDPGAAKLAFAGGKVVTLPQVMSADGGRYADTGMEFWIRGQGARLTVNGKETQCKTGD